jgi:parallel beta-helix repeat protein
MKRINGNLAVVTGMLLGLAGTTVPAQAAFTSISTCPFTISTPGDYQLTADLTCAGDGITITARGVSLKLNGHKITAAAGAHYGIFINPAGRADHIGISGPGLITNSGANLFSAAIHLQNADYSQVSQVAVVGADGDGIGAYNCTFLTVGSNVVSQGGGAGVFLSNTSSSTISWNDASGIKDNPGIFVQGGSANTVNNNTANGNGFFGIGVQNSPGTRVYGNVANGNAQWGIAVDSTGVQVFSNSSAMANGVFDLNDNSATCSGNLWANNVFFTRSQTCIH